GTLAARQGGQSGPKQEGTAPADSPRATDRPIWARPLPGVRDWRVRMGHEQAAGSASSWRQARSHGTAGAAAVAALAVAGRDLRDAAAVYLLARDQRPHPGQLELLAVHRGRQRPQDQDRNLRERRE